MLVADANGIVPRALFPRLTELGHDVVPVVRRQINIANEVIVHDASSWKAALVIPRPIEAGGRRFVFRSTIKMNGEETATG